MRKTHTKAFTLIEVLVVVSIIGILMSILTLSFTEARKHSRDSARKASLKQLQLALETYKAQNGSYPPQGCGAIYPLWAGSEVSNGGNPAIIPCAGNYIQGLQPDYIASLPSEPSSNKTLGYLYRVSADGSAYKLITNQSIETDYVTSYSDEFARCPRNCGGGVPQCSGVAGPERLVYAVYSKDAECW